MKILFTTVGAAVVLALSIPEVGAADALKPDADGCTNGGKQNFHKSEMRWTGFIAGSLRHELEHLAARAEG